MAIPLVDPHGRTVRDLRISITDRCNFRCTYCMPQEGMQWLPREELLSYEELSRVAGVCVERFGFGSIRITGGEPTVRAHLPVLIERLAELGTEPASAGDPGGTEPASAGDPTGTEPATAGDPGGIDLSMTTNAATLSVLAGDLRRAGLRRVNISCDSLRPDRFAAITGRDALGQVLAGIDAAVDVGLDPVKVNCVVVRGVNDDEVVDFAAFGRDRGVEVRFIEWMPLDGDGRWTGDQVVPASEIVAAVAGAFPLEPDEEPRGSMPAQRYRYLDGRGRVGVIGSVSQSFCSSCDRIRLTAEGQLRNCLFAVREADLRSILRGGGSDDDLAAAIEAEVGRKWAGHSIGQVHFIRPERSMSQIGG